MTFYDNRLGE